MNNLLTPLLRRYSLTHNLNHLRRFYKRVQFCANPKPQHPAHRFLITLDGKTIKTPNRHLLAVPSQRIALLLVHEFERQGEYLQPALMPMLSLCRTAIDVDMTDGLRENLVDSVYTFLPTDTLLFCGEQMAGFQERYDQLTPSLINRFCGHFKMEMQPVYSQDLIPPAFPGPSESFNKFVENCDNWKLIGLETIAIWLKSTISASLIIENLQDIDQVIKAARIEEQFQADRFGWVEEKIMEENNVRFMVNSAYLLAALSRH